MLVAAQIRINFENNLPSCRLILLIYTKESQMNKDQVKGMAKNIAGKVQEEAGKLAGNKKQQVKGLDKQISGQAEKVYGDAKEAIKNTVKDI